MTNDAPFQFGIQRLMLVTVIVAVIMAVAIRIGVVAQMFFGCILLFLLVWAFFRGRGFVADLKEVQQRRREVMQRRIALQLDLHHALRGRGTKESMATSDGETIEIAKLNDSQRIAQQPFVQHPNVQQPMESLDGSNKVYKLQD